jgi:hypothetical protein
MLDSEVDPAFFAGRVGKPDITAAVAEVASYKGAAAVFAPVGSQKGLTKLFDTGSGAQPRLRPDQQQGAAGDGRQGRGGGGRLRRRRRDRRLDRRRRRACTRD